MIPIIASPVSALIAISSGEAKERVSSSGQIDVPVFVSVAVAACIYLSLGGLIMPLDKDLQLAAHAAPIRFRVALNELL